MTSATSKNTFKVGDRVRRINHDNSSRMTVGTEWTVSQTYRTTFSDWLNFVEGGDGNAENFELVAPAKTPHLPVPATFEFPRAEVNAVLSEHFGKKLGIYLKVLGTSRVGEVCTFDAEVIPA